MQYNEAVELVRTAISPIDIINYLNAEILIGQPPEAEPLDLEDGEKILDWFAEQLVDEVIDEDGHPIPL